MRKIIGIVGGVGPYAGLDLNQKIFDNTKTSGKDQDHLEIYLLSRSPDIGDRTEFIQGKIPRNPAEGIYETLKRLSKIGADVMGIPCNTAHSALIFGEVKEKMASDGQTFQLMHMIEETYAFIREKHPRITKVGLLCTKGTYQNGLYANILEKEGKLTVLVPSEETQDRVHDSIYNTEYGIKAQSNPVSEKSVAMLRKEGNGLIRGGAQGIIMGCTEIPLALNQEMFEVPVIDPTVVLARALIENAAPEALKKA